MSGPDIKVVLLGHKNVGKTSIFNRYVYNDFGKTSMTIGAYFAMKQAKVDNRTYNLAIWDTAGEEKFDSLTNFYCRNAKAAVICYDVTSAPTFQGLKRWVDKITLEAEPNCAVVIVGNKTDIVEANPSARQVSFEEAKRYAKSMNFTAFEVSAASGANVEAVFSKLVTTALSRGSNPNPVAGPAASPNAKTVALDEKKSKSTCC